MRISDLSSGQDINKLKQLLASGVITNDDLNNANISGSFGPVQGTQNALTSLADPGPQNDPTIGSAMGLGHELYRGPNETDAPLAPQEKLIQDALAAQQGDQNALSRVQNAMSQGVSADKYGELPQGNNFVKNEQTGQVIYLGPNGQQSPSPSFGSTIGYSGGGAPPGGSAYTGSTRMMPQKQQDGPPVTRVLGSGSGTTVDLGGAGQNESVRPPLASGRNPIDIPGAGRGYYGTDGNAYVPNGDGSWTKVLLGYDMQGSMALNKYNLDQQKTQADIAATNERIRASQVQNPDMGTMGGVSNGLTGDDLLKTLDPGTAGLVKAYAEGRLAFPGGAAMRSPRMMQLLSLVSAYDPSFDAKDFNTRNKAQIAFTSGPQSNAVRAADQAITHAAALSDDIDKLNNFNGVLTPLNSVVNPIESTFGDPRQGRFKQNALALSAELRKVFASGGGGSLSELQSWESGLPVNASQEQQRQYLAKGMDLLQGAIGALNDQYKRAAGPRADIKNLLSPTAQAALQRLELGGGTPSAMQQGSAQPSQAPQTPNIPPQAIAFLRQNPAARADFDRKYGQGMAAQVLGQ